jgi:chromosome segregation ATPase
MQKYSKGFSSYLSIGNNKGLNFQKDGPSYRLNFFWISICIGFFDLEKMVHKLLEEVKEQEAYIENTKKELQNIDAIKKEIYNKEDEITKIKGMSHREKHELKSQIDEYKTSLSQLEESVKKLDDLENTLREKIEELSEENEDLNNEIMDLNDANEENMVLKERLDALESIIKERDKKIEELKAHIENLEKWMNYQSSSSSSSVFSSSSSAC